MSLVFFHCIRGLQAASHKHAAHPCKTQGNNQTDPPLLWTDALGSVDCSWSVPGWILADRGVGDGAHGGFARPLIYRCTPLSFTVTSDSSEAEQQRSDRVDRHESQMDAHDSNCKVPTAAAWCWCNPENTVEKKHFHIVTIKNNFTTVFHWDFWGGRGFVLQTAVVSAVLPEGLRSQRLQVSHVILSMIYL